MTNPSHGRIKRLRNRPVISLDCIAVPSSITCKWTTHPLDRPQLVPRVASVSEEHIHAYTSVFETLQVAHVVLVGVRNEQVVDLISTLLIQVRTRTPVVSAP